MNLRPWLWKRTKERKKEISKRKNVNKNRKRESNGYENNSNKNLALQLRFNAIPQSISSDAWEIFFSFSFFFFIEIFSIIQEEKLINKHFPMNVKQLIIKHFLSFSLGQSRRERKNHNLVVDVFRLVSSQSQRVIIQHRLIYAYYKVFKITLK